MIKKGDALITLLLCVLYIALAQFLRVKWEAVAAVSTAVLAISTILTVLFAKKQYDEFVLQRSASKKRETVEFALGFKRDFFTDKTRDLIMLCDNDLLEFIVDGDSACFKISTEKLGANRPCDVSKFLSTKDRSYYSTYEVDDWLLAHLNGVNGDSA